MTRLIPRHLRREPPSFVVSDAAGRVRYNTFQQDIAGLREAVPVVPPLPQPATTPEPSPPPDPEP